MRHLRNLSGLLFKYGMKVISQCLVLLFSIVRVHAICKNRCGLLFKNRMAVISRKKFDYLARGVALWLRALTVFEETIVRLLNVTKN